MKLGKEGEKGNLGQGKEYDQNIIWKQNSNTKFKNGLLIIIFLIYSILLPRIL